MTWLDEEIQKQRLLEEQRLRQEKIQRAQENARWEAVDALWQQREQQKDQMGQRMLEPFIASLQIRQLMRDARRKWGKTLNEKSMFWGNEKEINEPLRVTEGWWSITLAQEYTFRYSSSDIGGYPRTRDLTHTYSISVKLDFGQSESTMSFHSDVHNIKVAPVNMMRVSSDWIEKVTSTNHRYLVAKLKESLVQKIMLAISRN